MPEKLYTPKGDVSVICEEFVPDFDAVLPCGLPMIPFAGGNGFVSLRCARGHRRNIATKQKTVQRNAADMGSRSTARKPRDEEIWR